MDVLAFVQVAETGAFARAAERMGVSKSIASRRVARLEERLGAKLLTRTAQGAQPTEIGRAYHGRAASILAELEAAREVVAQATTEISGSIRLTAPTTFGSRHLAPALIDFARAHPRVDLDISLDDKRVDLVGGGFDLAIRIGDLRDSALVARKLTTVRSSLLASPAYLERRGRPERPADIGAHDLLVYTNLPAASQFRLGDERSRRDVGGAVRMRSDNGEMLLAAAVAGLGIANLPDFIASPQFASGALEMVLPSLRQPEVGLHAVFPPGRNGIGRLRALIEFLAARFGPEPHWDPCWNVSLK